MPTEMGLCTMPKGERERRWPVIWWRTTGLGSGWSTEGWLIFSISCLIFLTWLWIATPKYLSSLPMLLLLFFFCSISCLCFIEKITPLHTFHLYLCFACEQLVNLLTPIYIRARTFVYRYLRMVIFSWIMSMGR